jgi:hypothetical protein
MVLSLDSRQAHRPRLRRLGVDAVYVKSPILVTTPCTGTACRIFFEDFSPGAGGISADKTRTWNASLAQSHDTCQFDRMFRAEHPAKACHFDRVPGFAQNLRSIVKPTTLKQEGREDADLTFPAFMLSLF